MCDIFSLSAPVPRAFVAGPPEGREPLGCLWGRNPGGPAVWKAFPREKGGTSTRSRRVCGVLNADSPRLVRGSQTRVPGPRSGRRTSNMRKMATNTHNAITSVEAGHRCCSFVQQKEEMIMRRNLVLSALVCVACWSADRAWASATASANGIGWGSGSVVATGANGSVASLAGRGWGRTLTVTSPDGTASATATWGAWWTVTVGGTATGGGSFGHTGGGRGGVRDGDDPTDASALLSLCGAFEPEGESGSTFHLSGVGAAANRSIATGGPVEVQDLLRQT